MQVKTKVKESRIRIMRLTVATVLAGLAALALLLPGGPDPSAAAQEPDGLVTIDLANLTVVLPSAGSVAEAVDAQGVSQRLGNPGFESGSWVPWQTFGAPILDGSVKHSGLRSLHLGNLNNANDQALQTVTIPANATAVTFSFWYGLATVETNPNTDYFCAGLWPQNGGPAHVLRCADFGQSGNLAWSQDIYTLTGSELANVAGQTVWVGFLVQTNGSLPSRAWVDDAALIVTTPTAPPPPTRSTLFLPLVFKAPPVNSPPPPPQSITFWLPYTSATGKLLPTYGSSVAVDKAGGIHVAYTIYTGDDNGHRPAYYLYCPAACAHPANWSRTRLSDFVQDARLALDPAGHPRLLFYTSNNPNLPDNTHDYQYAVCDQGCSNNANWTINVVARVNEIPGRRSEKNNRYFALDGQGRPAFVYTDTTGGHNGTFYAYCHHNCTLAANWSETLLSNDHYFEKSALAFTPAGQPRLALDYFGFDEDRQAYLTKLLYLGCDTTCDNPGQWQSLFLYSSIGDANFGLRVDSQGRPRIALYPGNYVTSPLQPYRLNYAWCNSACFDPTANSWRQTNLNLPENHGGGVDLVLDQANRPRLVYEMDGTGLGYAWCVANCESATPNWQSRMVESTTSIIAKYPNLPVYSCSIQTWFNGKRPSLALNPEGKPHIGYDAEHWWGGYDKYGNKCNVDVPLARFALFN